jgi:hypothetical protein
MGEVRGNLLLQAITVAINPLPIIGLILMLFFKKAKARSIAFLLVWIPDITVPCVADGKQQRGDCCSPAHIRLCAAGQEYRRTDRINLLNI